VKAYKPPAYKPYKPPAVKAYKPPAYKPYKPPAYKPYKPPAYKPPGYKPPVTKAYKPPAYKPPVVPAFKPYVPPPYVPYVAPPYVPYKPPAFAAYTPPAFKPYLPPASQAYKYKPAVYTPGKGYSWALKLTPGKPYKYEPYNIPPGMPAAWQPGMPAAWKSPGTPYKWSPASFFTGDPRFTKFGANGFPTHDVNGNPLSPAALASLKAEMMAAKRYNGLQPYSLDPFLSDPCFFPHSAVKFNAKGVPTEDACGNPISPETLKLLMAGTIGGKKLGDAKQDWQSGDFLTPEQREKLFKEMMAQTTTTTTTTTTIERKILIRQGIENRKGKDKEDRIASPDDADFVKDERRVLKEEPEEPEEAEKKKKLRRESWWCLQVSDWWC